MFMGAGVNIILDPVFIYVFDMGMAGGVSYNLVTVYFNGLILLST